MQPTDKEAGSGRPLVVVNVGNTHARWVLFDGVMWEETRVPTSEVEALAEPPSGVAIALASVVPTATAHLLERWSHREVFVVDARAARGMPIAYDPPTSIGADRLANAYALHVRHGGGIAVDFGTATTLTVVVPGRGLVGGAIMPGLTTAMASLFKNTAQLPEVPVELPDLRWGGSTRESIQLGVVGGQVGSVGHLVKQMSEGLPAGLPVIVTGGWASLMARHLPTGYRHEPTWTLDGVRLLYEASTN